MPTRYPLPRTVAVLSTIAVALALGVPAASAGPSAAAPATVPSRLAGPVWMPEWLTPGLPTDVTDYSALYAAPTVPIAPGMLVAIDPETGMPIQPTAQQLRALTVGIESTDLLEPSDAPMQIEHLPGGGITMHLNGNFQVYSVARIGPDGRPVTDCSVDKATARRLLVTPTRVAGEKRVAQ